MLYSDQDILTPDELYSVDSQAQAVAAAESISLSGDNGIISRASDACIEFILGHCQAFSTYYGDGSGNAAHNAAVSNIGGTRNTRARVTPYQIILSSTSGGRWSPLKEWGAQMALALLYKSALNNNLTDRYADKVRQLREDIKREYWPAVDRNGIPIIFTPLPAPAARRSPTGVNPGTWGAGNLSAVAGSGAAGAWDVAITYVDQSRYVSSLNVQNAESHPTVVATVETALNQNVQVSIASLNPPAGETDKQDIGLFVPLKATGWNVYAGASGGPLYLQNAAPVPIATKTQSFAVVSAGTTVGNGQFRDSNLFFFDYINRA